MNFVSEVIPMWIKVGVAGSVVWAFLLYVLSRDGLRLIDFSYAVDGGSLAIIGCAIIWLLSFLFVRKKPTD